LVNNIARKTYEELNKIKEQFQVDTLWSFSRYNLFKTSKYEYFLKYILKKEEDRTDCVYAPMGGMAHDILERFYKGKITYEKMLDEFDDAWITLIDVSQLKFDRNDEEKNKKIANKYYANLQHFFKTHKKLDFKLDTERFITIKIADNIVFQGYMDGVYKNEKDEYIILDFKTSTIYTGEKAIKESAQLLLYAMALNQLGVPFEKIKIAWNFLKYCNVMVTQAKQDKKTKIHETTTRNIERNEIGNKLQSNTKMWLNKSGYEDQLIEYLDLLIQTNSIECLPKDVQAKYKIDDCYVYINITPELLHSLKNDIIATVKEIEEKTEQYKETQDNSLFYDDEEEVKKQSYYYATLSGYSANLNPCYKKYLDKLTEEKENKDNLFAGIGVNNKEDLSWLNDL